MREMFYVYRLDGDFLTTITLIWYDLFLELCPRDDHWLTLQLINL